MRRDRPTRPRSGPHAPARGRLRRLLGPLHFSGVAWYRLHAFAARALPEWALGMTTRAFSLAFYLALGGVRRAVHANRELVSGPCGRWTRFWRSYGTIHTFAWCLTERYEQFAPGKQLQLEVRDPAPFERALERGKGVILATSHIGNWEAGSTAPLRGHPGVRVHIVREEELDERAQRFVSRLLADLGGAEYHTHFASGDASLGIALLAALRRGEIVALQADRPRAGGKTLRVPLLGRELEIPEGPVALARLADAPILPAFTFREARARYRIEFREPVVVGRTRDRAADHLAAGRELARSIEWAIREHPEQWFCFADLTAERPR